MTKRNAFLIHLGLSILVFSILLMLIIYVWYPAPYFDMEYRMKWIKLIAFVDIVIGPGLTLLVFKPDKPSIRFDMSVILALQLSALAWGVWNVWSVHPVLNVYFESQIYCLDSKDVRLSDVEKKLLSTPMPDKLMAILPYPETIEKKTEYLKQAKGDRPMVYYLGHMYEAAATDKTISLNQNQSGFMSVVEASEQHQKQWQDFISAYQGINSDWRYYRLNCIGDDRTAVFNRKTNTIEAVLKIRLPIYWEFQ
ncbi:MAG: hypothetical protein OEY11_08820 [Gammaproteobacteria bacterium]|nr:hypothetical protein [Gammaproteobacteria bacterium]